MLKIIFLLGLVAFVSPACESITPSVFTDCVVKSDSLNYCCYAYSPIGKKCISRSRAEWKSTDRITLSEYNTEYILDCGIASTYKFNATDVNYAMGIPANMTSLTASNQGLPEVGKSCGSNKKGNDLTLKDCHAGSYPFNDCCLYEFDNNRMCFSLGKTYNGNLTYGKVKVTCSSEWNKVHLIMFLSILLIFI
jgi:hypothetical protein